jgi:inorganic pyrophosphatase
LQAIALQSDLNALRVKEEVTMNLSNIPVGAHAPQTVNVIIEIPAGNRNKYEYDEDLHIIKVDRVGYTAMAHPYDYGFVPETRSEDGDHLDAFVLLNPSVFPGCLVEARPVGVVMMRDDGEMDEKLICVPAQDPRYNHVTDLSQLSPHISKEIQHFFEHYKDLQGKKTEVTDWGDAQAAHDIIEAAAAAFAKESH